MSRYVIVSFLEKATLGITFSKSEWLLHLTILRPFFSDNEDGYLIGILKDSLLEKQKVTSTGKVKEMFGPNKDVAVTELEHNTRIQDLHDSIESAFKPFIRFESEQYPTYRPHVTNQGSRGIVVGEEVVINSVSLVKIDNDSRQVLATVALI
ncbi:2'-5' RNA ligase family protein [Candidatus Nomurabacteria bacterium]|nr:2'-5' RNA ligase family protein [Candidatus Nomurabacteria bacterium]